MFYRFEKVKTNFRNSDFYLIKFQCNTAHFQNSISEIIVKSGPNLQRKYLTDSRLDSLSAMLGRMSKIWCDSSHQSHKCYLRIRQLLPEKDSRSCQTCYRFLSNLVSSLSKRPLQIGANHYQRIWPDRFSMLVYLISCWQVWLHVWIWPILCYFRWWISRDDERPCLFGCPSSLPLSTFLLTPLSSRFVTLQPMYSRFNINLPTNHTLHQCIPRNTGSKFPLN